MDRIILHCDGNNFFASCECTVRPELRKVPMAVAGDPESRHGIILAKNDLAKKAGVQTAEPIWQAKRKCPNLVCVPATFDLYHSFYERINKIYLSYTDLVEPFSIDESFLDITGCMHLHPGKSPRDIADEIRARVRSELGITVSVGVSFCKTFAKLGSDYKKPDATTVIFREDVPSIVYPLPVSDLVFVGKKTTEILSAHAVKTVGELAQLSEDYLVRILGKQGKDLYTVVHCLEESQVRDFYDYVAPKSVSHGMTFRRDLLGESEVKSGVSVLADRVASRLRFEGFKGSVVQVTLKDPSFRQIQRQKKLSHPTYLQKEITDISMELIRENWDFSKPIRLITIGVNELVPKDEETVEQVSLFDTEESHTDTKKQEAIEDTMASIREKFGDKSIKFGYSSDSELGIK
ncbi:MAG: DNA polymerase IV [Clostridiales bacterium]|nr:DNA polymerase IV [Clostridiales bacterium]